jgi:hypothetical protein
MNNLKHLLKDLEYFEGLLYAYDGDGQEGKEVRENLRARIAGIRQDLEPYRARENANDTEPPLNGKAPINGKDPLNGKTPINGKSPISGKQVTLATDDAEEGAATYSQESA